ncbi:MAG: DNA-binding MarR family transcriptional regulator [Natronomonas sp.]|jgi:DNA-binding MarR family transcriptional regulator|uniref:MarR family transcriptional regulator n=1 Tax=Natronomonas sp. TaxID=2184060 RepID=UPI00398987EA
MATSPDWTHPADERILSYLDDHPPDYIPLIANRLGMHLGYVERRVDTLVKHELVEPVTGEEIYAVTERGEQYLTDDAAAILADSDD